MSQINDKADLIKIKRRKLLSSATATTIGGLSILPKSAAAISADKLGSVQLLEAVLTHENSPNFPIVHNDDVQPFILRDDSRELILNDYIDNSYGEKLVQHDLAIWNGSEISTNAKTFGRDHKKAELGGGSYLVLDEHYAEPVLSVTPTKSGIRVKAGRESKEVGPSERATLRLQPRQTRAKGRDGSRTVELTPVLKVMNHGRVEVKTRGGK